MPRGHQRLRTAFIISLVILFAEVLGGIISGSLALLSDAGHVLTDSFALAMSFIASRLSQRPSDYRATYGYQRIGLLAAVINGSTLLLVSGYIFYEAVRRFTSSFEINPSVMLPVAVFGLFGNALMALVLSKDHHDLNIKSAWLHIVGDLLASVGVVIASVIIILTGWRVADPIAGMVVGILILVGGLRVVRDALWVFLEFVPRGIEPESLVEKIRAVEGVRDVHDVHIWSISHGRVAFSAHVLVKDQLLSDAERIRKAVEEVLEKEGIDHSVIQLEYACSGTNGGIYCQQ
ncbi:MAG: cation transporter [Nitrospirae bacterium]|nr:MAG: cation transporter [Nitrospirota bacterium]